MKTAEYQVVTASLSNDFKEAVAFNLRKHKARIQINLIGLWMFKICICLFFFLMPTFPKVDSTKHVQEVTCQDK